MKNTCIRIALAGICILIVMVVIILMFSANVDENNVYNMDAYFSNIRKGDLSIHDAEKLPRFQFYTGATPQEAIDYNTNKSLYFEYIADVYLSNNSEYATHSIWVTRFGSRVEFPSIMDVKVIKGKSIASDDIWVYAWLNEGMTWLEPYEKVHGTLRIIVKKQKDVTDDEIIDTIEKLPITLHVLVDKNIESGFGRLLNIKERAFLEAQLVFKE